MIEFAEVQDGLCMLWGPTVPPKFINVTHTDVVSSSNDCHFRLGHLSHDKLCLLNKNFLYISIPKCNTNCTICPLAKQQKLPFL